MKYQDLTTYTNPNGFRGRSKFVVQLWWIVQQTLFAWSPQFMFGWRRFLLRCFGADIGKSVRIRPSVKTTYPWKVTIGNYSWIGDEVVLYSLGAIDIGAHTVISQRSYLCTGTHSPSDTTFPISAQPICIQSQCWLATDVYVAPGITIGEGTVVGARSSVFKDLVSNKIYLGTPLKAIRDRK